MLEHIFRNINDIRVFDIFYVEFCDGEEVDIDQILKSLEYTEIEHIQIEDSVEHLVTCKILEKVYNKLEGWNGCKTCLYTDKLKLPRIGEHKKHQPFEKIEDEFPYYRIAINELTYYLYKAMFEYLMMYGEDVQKDKNEGEKVNEPI